MRLKGCLILLACAGVFVGAGLSQVTTGTISGTVKDPSGAVLPGAQVVILNEDTGVSRTATADSAGRYAAPQLGLGNYRVSASLAGFQTEARTGVVLTVGREATVDFQLQVGAVAQTVEVTGEAPLVQTAEATVGYLVADKSIRDLPLNGRDVTQLILLNPGVVAAVNSAANSGTVGYGKRISISGSRGEDNAYLLDGSYINDFGRHIPAGPSGALLGAETIREFQVLTNSFSAQYGRAMGGVFNAVTKSGANEWHGSLYDFVRNDALDAKDVFDPQRWPFVRNQFGGSISGPVKRDRTFFFTSYEGLRESLTTTQKNIVPDENAHKGILPTKTVTISPSVVPFLAAFPLPTPGGKNNGDGTAEYIFPANQPTVENFGQGRVDHQLSANDSLFARFTASNSERVSVADYPGNVTDQFLNSRLLTISETHILSPAALNTFRASFNRVAPISSTTGFPAPAGVITIPGQAMPGISPGNSISGFNGNVTPKIQFLTNRFNETDDVNWTLGSHSVKFGGMLERLQFNVDQPNRGNGTWTFGSLEGFLQAGQTITGTVTTPSQYRGTPPTDGVGSVRGMRQWFTGLYLQDDWQVRAGLTLNLGLRWDRSSVPTEVNGKIVNIRNRTDAKPTVGDPYWLGNKGNLAPRFGFAWTPFSNGKTSVRGGIGMFYVPTDPGVWFRAMARMAPLFAEYQFNNPSGFPDPLAAIKAATVSSYGTVYVFSYQNLRTPHSLQYNLNVQQQLDKSSVLTVGYVGSRGLNLVALENWNMPQATYDGTSLAFPVGATVFNPNYTCICFYNDDTDSWYNALTASFQRRFSGGLQTQVSYTWAKTINMNDGNNTGQNVTNSDFSIMKYTYDGKANRGLSGYGIPMALIVNYSYDLPLGRGMKGFAGHALAGWQLNGIFTAQRGQPFTVTSGTPAALTAAQVGTRSPNLISGFSSNPTRGTSAGCTILSNGSVTAPIASGTTPPANSRTIAAGTPIGTPDLYYDPCAFTFPGAQQLGNLGRNTLLGPGLVKWDFSLLKNNAITERYNLQFRAEVFNLFNHPNFGGPASSLFSNSGAPQALAGQISNTLKSNWRQIQLALRLVF